MYVIGVNKIKQTKSSILLRLKKIDLCEYLWLLILENIMITKDPIRINAICKIGLEMGKFNKASIMYVLKDINKRIENKLVFSEALDFNIKTK